MDDILVAVDFSELTQSVLDEGVRQADRSAAEVWLLHVAEPDPDFVGYEAGPQSVREGVAKELRDERNRLKELADGLETRGVSATPIVVQGPTVETILREADKLQVRLIVMGSHGYGALRRTLLGSVSEGVLRRTTRPILIVPARA